jgi:hypothetical protein
LLYDITINDKVLPNAPIFSQSLARFDRQLAAQ